MSEPLVSLLMTSYNRENYIADAIKSVLASTYTHFELIITDDGSTDQTVQIARQFETKDRRIRVYQNETNLGDYVNRNKAASYAKGKYLKYLDSDDMIYPHGLQVMVNAMEQFPSAAYGFSYRQKQLSDPPFPWQVQPVEAYSEHFSGGGFFYAGPGSSIIRRDVFEEAGGFSGKRFVGDTELWMMLSQKYSCVVFQPFLIWWRIHEGQESVTERETLDGLAMRFNNDVLFLSHPACPLDEHSKINVLKNSHRIMWRKIVHKVVTSGNFELYRRTKPLPGQLPYSFLPINRWMKISQKFKRRKMAELSFTGNSSYK